MNELQVYYDAIITPIVDFGSVLLLVGLGLVVCGFVAEAFYQRNRKILREEQIKRESRQYAEAITLKRGIIDAIISTGTNK